MTPSDYNSGVPENALQSTSLPPAVPGVEYETDTYRFNQFIWAENERLNRLIRNLYLQFQLKHFTERELYDRICEEVANYFWADSCSLYLIRYEEVEVQEVLTLPRGKQTTTKYVLAKWLELVGAAGPWRRALRQQYVRRRSSARYELPFDDRRPEEFTSATCRGFRSVEPKSYVSSFSLPRQDSSSVDFLQNSRDLGEGQPGDQKPLKEDVPRQVVWRNDGLYNTFRSMVLAPLIRQSDQKDYGAHHHVGVIKVENRSPYGISGFAEVPLAKDASHHLFFEREWRVAALRPYVRDLYERTLQPGADPYEPLINDVGWQQYFEDHAAAGRYYEQLLSTLRLRRKSVTVPADGQEVIHQYGRLEQWLRGLVECLQRLEAWLQHVRYACGVLCGLGEPPSLDRPIRSLFNVHNFRAAYLVELARDPKGILLGSVPDNQKPDCYSVVFDAFLNRLLADEQETRQRIRAEASVLAASEVALRLLTAELDAHWPREALEGLQAAIELLAGEPTYKDRVARLRDEIQQRLQTRHHKKDLNAAARTLVSDIDALRELVRHTLENRIEDACRKRADAVRLVLASSENSLDVREVVRPGGSLPDWKLEDAVGRVVLGDLSEISRSLVDISVSSSSCGYELAAEEAEMRRVSEAVLHLLESKQSATDAEVTIPSRDNHPSLCNTVCRAAAALAEATMYADSFNRVDENRLVLIASHVTQVLDNQLLYQARQRELELDYESLGTLGLSTFGLELLDRLEFLRGRIEAAVIHLIYRQAYRRQEYERKEDLPKLIRHTNGLSEFVQNLQHVIRMGGERIEFYLLELQFLGDYGLLSNVLDEIARHASQLDLMFEHGPEGREVDENPEPDRKAKWRRCLLFRPRDAIKQPGFQDEIEIEIRLSTKVEEAHGDLKVDEVIPKGSASTVMFGTPPVTPHAQSFGGGCDLDLRLTLPPDPVYRRDLRCLWIAVKMLADLADTLDLSCGGPPNADS